MEDLEPYIERKLFTVNTAHAAAAYHGRDRGWVSIREAQPVGMVKKGETARALIIRTAAPIRRPDGSTLSFDHNAVILIDDQKNPRGSRIFGPVARELRDLNYMKVISLAPEVL